MCTPQANLIPILLRSSRNWFRAVGDHVDHILGLGGVPMRFEAFSFGSIRIDGVTYDHDVVIDQGKISKRSKKPSKKFREEFGHTPLSVEEAIPWRCRRLVIGTGTGALPVMEEVKDEARRRKIKLLTFRRWRPSRN